MEKQAQRTKNQVKAIQNQHFERVSKDQRAQTNGTGIGAQQKIKAANKTGKGAEELKMIQCPHCESMFKRQKDLNKHMKKFHANEWVVAQEKKKQLLLDAEYECDVCHKKFMK